MTGICRQKGCIRPAKTKGFCRAHYMRTWRAQARERVDNVRIPSREDVDRIWEMMEYWGGIPLQVAAAHLGLKVTGEVLTAIRSRAEAASVDLEANERAYAAMAEGVA